MTDREQTKWSWGVAIDQGFVWALLTVPVSLGIMILAFVSWAPHGLANGIFKVLCFSYTPIATWLVAHNFLDPRNVFGAMVLGHVIPWMLAGYLYGFARGWSIATGTILNSRAVRLFSLLIDLGIWLLASFAFWW